MNAMLPLQEHTKNYGKRGDRRSGKFEREIEMSHLQVFSRIRLSLPIRIHRYRIDGVEIDIVILILNLRLATIVGGTVCV
jgi:hypothetical protein